MISPTTTPFKKLKDFLKTLLSLIFNPTIMINYSPTRNGIYLNIPLKETNILKEKLHLIKIICIILFLLTEKKLSLIRYSISFYHSGNKIPKNLLSNLKILTLLNLTTRHPKLLLILPSIEDILKPGILLLNPEKEMNYFIFILNYTILFKKKKSNNEKES